MSYVDRKPTQREGPFGATFRDMLGNVHVCMCACAFVGRMLFPFWIGLRESQHANRRLDQFGANSYFEI